MYTIISAIKNVYRNRFINFTVIVSLSLGLLFPMLVFCIGNVTLKSIWGGLAYNPERVVAVNTDEKIRINIEKAKADYSEIELMVEGAFVASDYAVVGDKFIKTEVVGYKAGHDRIFRYDMLYGRYFTDSESNGNESVCIISSALQKELDCNVGDSLTLSDKNFSIKGVYISDEAFVRIPLEAFSKMYRTMYAYDIQFDKSCDVKTKGVEILNKLADEYKINNRDFLIANDYYDTTNELKNAYFALAIMLAIASVVLIYAALNISNIMVNKINSDLKSYTIRMQLGAAKSNIFGFLLVQLFALMLISVGIDALIIFLLKKYMPFFAVFPFDLDLPSVLLTALIGTVYVLILSSGLLKRAFGERMKV